MQRLTHFATTFVIIWVLLSALYAVVIFQWGFGVGWTRQPAPPIWVLHLLFYLWPIIPALFITVSWELLRVLVLRTN